MTDQTMSNEEYRAHRERLGFTHVQMAEALGIGRNTSMRYERPGWIVPKTIRLAIAGLDAEQKPDS